MSPKINTRVLMSGAEYFSDAFAINALMDSTVRVDLDQAVAEHSSVRQALESVGVEVIKVDAPPNLQDGVYTANWGLFRGDKVVKSSLPNKRRGEEIYAEKAFRQLNKTIIKPPFRFSGQGDSLPCGNLLFCGSNYRTDPRMHEFLANELGYEVISLQTIPEVDDNNQPVINPITGWPDSFFYDLDLALAVITPELIAWCPEAFVPESKDIINQLNIDKIEVSFEEAKVGLACNLVSTGQSVIMSANAPQLKFELEAQGFKTITPKITELGKGGGYLRCVTLTLDNN